MTSLRLERGETCFLCPGCGIALLLTLAAFGMVALHVLTRRQAFHAVPCLGLVQLVMRFRFFPHVDLKRSARADLQPILFSGLIVALMVGDTLGVLCNLNGRMM